MYLVNPSYTVNPSQLSRAALPWVKSEGAAQDSVPLCSCAVNQIWTDAIAFCCCFSSADGRRRRVRTALITSYEYGECGLLHAHITDSSLCLVRWVPWCIEFQHKNLRNVIKKHWFSFTFHTHLRHYCSSRISPKVSWQFQKKRLVLDVIRRGRRRLRAAWGRAHH